MAVPVLLVALLLLVLWWARAADEGRVGILRVLDARPGTEVVLSLQAIQSIDGPDRYVVSQGTLEIPVIGPTAGLRVGQELTVGGVVGRGEVHERWRAFAPDRPAKRALGVAGLALAGVVFAAGVRPTRQGLVTRG